MKKRTVRALSLALALVVTFTSLDVNVKAAEVVAEAPAAAEVASPQSPEADETVEAEEPTKAEETAEAEEPAEPEEAAEAEEPAKEEETAEAEESVKPEEPAKPEEPTAETNESTEIKELIEGESSEEVSDQAEQTEDELLANKIVVTDKTKSKELVGDSASDKVKVTAPKLYNSNGEELKPNTTTEVADDLSLYFATETTDCKIFFTMMNKSNVVYNNIEFGEDIKMVKGANYVFKAYAQKGNSKSETVTWTVKGVSAIEEPPFYTLSNKEKMWVVYTGSLFKDELISVTYTGAPIKLTDYQVYFGKTLLEEGKDYTVSYRNNKNVAAYNAVNAPTMTITGKGSIQGKLVKHFSIVAPREGAMKLTASNVAIRVGEESSDGITFNGKPKEPALEIKLKATKNSPEKYIAKSDYNVIYENNVNAGTAKAIITFNGRDYYGTITKTFKINRLNVNDESFYKSIDYESTEKGLKGSTIAGTLKHIKFYNRYTHEDLTATKQIVVSMSAVNRAKRLYAFKLTGRGNYTGTISVPATEIPAFEMEGNVTIKDVCPPIASNKKGVYKPVSYKAVVEDGTVLKVNRDYTVSYLIDDKPADNKKVYPANTVVTMVFTGKGDFEGTLTAKYTIAENYSLSAKDTVSNESIIDAKVSNVAYTGKATGVNPKVVLKNTYTNKVLKNKSDYEVKYVYAYGTKILRTVNKKNTECAVAAGELVGKKDIVPAGTTIKAIITGKGAYEGSSIEKNFTVGYDLSKASVKIKNQTYKGKRILPAKSDITVKVGGKVLKPSEYNVIYANTSNTKAGTGKVTITGTNTSCNQKTVSFKILAKKL